MIDWQNRYAEVINGTFAPMWATAMAVAALKSTKGKMILSDSDTDVKDWIRAHGGELISRLSDENKRARQSLKLFSVRSRRIHSTREKLRNKFDRLSV